MGARVTIKHSTKRDDGERGAMQKQSKMKFPKLFQSDVQKIASESEAQSLRTLCNACRRSVPLSVRRESGRGRAIRCKRVLFILLLLRLRLQQGRGLTDSTASAARRGGSGANEDLIVERACGALAGGGGAGRVDG